MNGFYVRGGTGGRPPEADLRQGPPPQSVGSEFQEVEAREVFTRKIRFKKRRIKNNLAIGDKHLHIYQAS